MSAKELAAEYRDQLKPIQDAVAGMSAEQLLARPVPGKMSTLEVICHLADFEPVYVDRIKRILTHENPTLLGADENLFRAGLRYQMRDLGEEMAIINSTRIGFSRILATLTPEELARKGTHSERGVVSAEDLIRLAIWHVNHHLPFIHEKRKAFA